MTTIAARPLRCLLASRLRARGLSRPLHPRSPRCRCGRIHPPSGWRRQNWPHHQDRRQSRLSEGPSHPEYLHHFVPQVIDENLAHAWHRPEPRRWTVVAALVALGPRTGPLPFDGNGGGPYSGRGGCECPLYYADSSRGSGHGENGPTQRSP